MSYSSKDKKPFAELEIIHDAKKKVRGYLDRPENAKNKKID